jgi:hypothetical protein
MNAAAIIEKKRWRARPMEVLVVLGRLEALDASGLGTRNFKNLLSQNGAHCASDR